MKARIISLLEVQRSLASLAEQFSEECSAIIVTRNNQPLLSIMPYETHQALLANIESLQTLLEIVARKEVGEINKAGKAPVLCEHSISWEEFQKEVGWE